MTEETTERAKVPQGLLVALCVVLGALIVGFLALSAVDLYSWARSSRGLNQPAELAWILPFAFDFGALVCILMTLICTYQGVRPGPWSVMVWLLAGYSANSQMRHGFAERDAGRAQDLWWAMPTVALLGPLMLEIAVRYFRRFRRVAAGEQLTASAGFGARWLPGIAFRETFAAWRASRQEGISDAAEAIAFVRDRKALRELATQPADAVRYALAELATHDAHAARKWLQRRGIVVTQVVMDEVDAQLTAKMTQPATQGRAKVTRPEKVRQADPVTQELEIVPAPPVRQKVPVPAASPATSDADAKAAAVALVRRDGLSNREAAARVGISEATVRRALQADQPRVNGAVPQFAGAN